MPDAMRNKTLFDLTAIRSRQPPAHGGMYPMERPPRFFMYDEPAMNHSWLRACPNVVDLLSRAKRERHADMFAYDLFVDHPKRTRNASEAVLFVVGVWEYTSWVAERCEHDGANSTHFERMRAASRVLINSPYYKAAGGYDHVILSNAGLVGGRKPARERLGPLGWLLKPAIAGRDRVYPGAYGLSAIGRCTFGLPYVANPHIHRVLQRESAPRRILLYFSGSMSDVCCNPGKSVRRAVQQLMLAHGNASDVLLRDVKRENSSYATGDSRWMARADYVLQAEEMVASDFCLVPYGDTETSSRLYSAIASGCIPVIVSDALAGAFASAVPYERLTLRVAHAAFISAPHELVPRLRALPDAARARMRAGLLRHAVDVVYEVPASRVADHILTTAYYSCVHDPNTSVLATASAASSADPRRYGMNKAYANCTCVAAAPPLWWTSPPPKRSLPLREPQLPTDVCRCAHCFRPCEGTPITRRVYTPDDDAIYENGSIVSIRGGMREWY